MEYLVRLGIQSSSMSQGKQWLCHRHGTTQSSKLILGFQVSLDDSESGVIIPRKKAETATVLGNIGHIPPFLRICRQHQVRRQYEYDLYMFRQHDALETWIWISCENDTARGVGRYHPLDPEGRGDMVTNSGTSPHRAYNRRTTIKEEPESCNAI